MAKAFDDRKNILTKEGEHALRDELRRLIDIDRPAVISEIKDAREQGDLSENAEFDAARERQGVIEDRIKEIEGILANAKILSDGLARTNKIRIGSLVTIMDLSDANKKHTYHIVGSLEANPFEDKISNVSPLAVALIGASEGDVVTVDTTEKYEVKVVAVK